MTVSPLARREERVRLRGYRQPGKIRPLTSHIKTDAHANLIGSAWMIAAMAGFALEDALLKTAAKVLPIWQVLVLFEVFGRLFYVLAIALTPLSSATVILQATPLVVVAGAALFFGETVGWRRWSTILVGLIGVVIIIQPTGDSFSALSILAVLGMLGFAGRDLASRAAPATLGTTVLGFYGFLSIVVAGGLYRAFEGAAAVPVDAQTALHLTGAVVMGAVAYSSLMLAMRTGEVSAVTPFRYTRLLFGIGLGVLIFDEHLDQTMWLGSALIVASGLYILWRGRQRPQPFS